MVQCIQLKQPVRSLFFPTHAVLTSHYLCIDSSNSTSTTEHVHDHSEEEESGHSHGISCEVETITDYNMPLRIGSVFIILVTSAVGKYYVFLHIAVYNAY
jgi:hypothetical protein